MTQLNIRTLILACGNTLRSDDGVGPHLAAWAEDHFRNNPTIRVISRHQWTPDLAEDLAHADSALFLDCSIDAPPGSVQLREVYPATPAQALATHHIGAPELLALALELYSSAPRSAQLLTVGAASLDLGEAFSPAVTAAIPSARATIERTVTCPPQAEGGKSKSDSVN
jgi:hydrogenase maturation protease